MKNIFYMFLVISITTSAQNLKTEFNECGVIDITNSPLIGSYHINQVQGSGINIEIVDSLYIYLYIDSYTLDSSKINYDNEFPFANAYTIKGNYYKCEWKIQNTIGYAKSIDIDSASVSFQFIRGPEYIKVFKHNLPKEAPYFLDDTLFFNRGVELSKEFGETWIETIYRTGQVADYTRIFYYFDGRFIKSIKTIYEVKNFGLKILETEFYETDIKGKPFVKGSIKHKGKWKDGLRSGRWKYYNQDGKIIDIKRY